MNVDGMPQASRILFLVTEDWYFLSHRLSVARACHTAGAKVSVACGVGEGRDTIEREGIEVIPYPCLARRRISLRNILETIWRLRALLRRTPHDVVVNVSIFVVLAGTLAALFSGSKRIVNILTGLGFIFVSKSATARIMRAPVLVALFLFARSSRVLMVVQNRYDFEMLEKLGFKPAQTLFLIRGSGVDIEHFRPAERESKERLVTFVGRMLESKGVLDLLAAARLLKERRYRIVLVGTPDPTNPQSISDEELLRASADGVVEFWGWRSDIASIYRQSAMAVLPSWREGLPKTLLEAAACGLPMVATDVPGCTEIVRHEETGLLVPERDPQALAEAIDRMMTEESLRLRLGQNARRLVEAELSEASINRASCAVILGRLDQCNVDRSHRAR